MQRIEARQYELAELEEDQWTEELIEETEVLEARYLAIEATIEAAHPSAPRTWRSPAASQRSPRWQPGSHPRPRAPRRHPCRSPRGRPGRPDCARRCHPRRFRSLHRPGRPAARQGRPGAQTAGVGIGLGDDLRAIRNTHVKLHLSGDFDAAFDLLLFQLARAVFSQAYQPDALDITFRRTVDRPFVRGNDDNFAAWNPAEAQLDDLSISASTGWRSTTTARPSPPCRPFPTATSRPVRRSSRAHRQGPARLRAQCPARTRNDHRAPRYRLRGRRPPNGLHVLVPHPEKRTLDIARTTVGSDWATSHGKFKRPELAKAMEEAFAAGGHPAGVAPENMPPRSPGRFPASAPTTTAPCRTRRATAPGRSRRKARLPSLPVRIRTTLRPTPRRAPSGTPLRLPPILRRTKPSPSPTDPQGRHRRP